MNQLESMADGCKGGMSLGSWPSPLLPWTAETLKKYLKNKTYFKFLFQEDELTDLAT